MSVSVVAPPLYAVESLPVAAHQPAFALLWQPLSVAALLFYLSYGLDLDHWLAGVWYQLEGGRWALQQHWLAEDVLHRGVRSVNQLAVAALLGFSVWQSWRSRFEPARRQSQRPLWLLTSAVALSLALVGLLKHSMPMACPWDLQAFGGTLAFTGLWQAWPAGQAPIACFPAGHASIGYAWLALYFYARQQQSRHARRWLLAALAAGVVLGLTQQLRGAHFLSHDIVTAALCWTVSWTLFRFGIARPVVTPRLASLGAQDKMPAVAATEGVCE